MEQYEFHPTLLLRCPAYPFSHKDSSSLQEHLDSQYFKNALFIAAPGFYFQLEKVSFEVGRLKPKARKSLLNYLNRLHFRSTPFGLFSGFASVLWQPAFAETSSVVLSGLRLHIMPALLAKGDGSALTGRWQQRLVFSNPSLYYTGADFRFLRSSYRESEKLYEYSISSIDEHPAIASILTICRTPIEGRRLCSELCRQLQIDNFQAERLVGRLIEDQLLLVDVGDRALYHKVPSFATLSEEVLRKEEIKSSSEEVYSVLEHCVDNGTLSVEHQKNIRDGLDALVALCPDVAPDGLRQFRIEFNKKFDGRSVPLMVALDPELGIGYRKLERSFYFPPLLNNINFQRSEAEHKEIHWTAVHAMFLNKMTMASNICTDGIEIRDEDLSKLPKRKRFTPPSLSVLFRPLHQQSYLESCGGPTSTAILGRFGIFNEDIRQMLNELAGQEVKFNQKVVFAEINAVQHVHTANVERRLKIFPYELPLAIHPGSAIEETICLSDLLVTVRGERIVLWSKKLQKEVIPRLSSAYNHTRSELNVYRFLCDLQYQGIQTNFTLELSHFFPFLSFYPRVSYKDAILSLATWHISKESLAASFADKVDITDLLGFLKGRGIPRHFATYKGDQQLVFDMNSDAELSQVCDLLEQEKMLIIKEFPFVEGAGQVQDLEGRSYLPQYVAAMINRQEVYGNPVAKDELNTEVAEERMPDQWLYFKLYCHPGHSIDLIESVASMVESELRSDGLVDLFYYVIYNDPGYHLRVRVRCVATDDKGLVFMKFQNYMNAQRGTGRISNFQIDTYERELERYGSGNIEIIEEIFNADTQRILQKGLQSYQEGQALAQIANDVDVLLCSFGYSLQQKLSHCQQHFQSLFCELNGDKVLLSDIKEKYRSAKAQLKFDSFEPASGSQVIFIDILSALVRNLIVKNGGKSVPSNERLCSDLIHIHLNRLFLTHPREQEMVLYYFLEQCYKSMQYRSVGTMLDEASESS